MERLRITGNQEIRRYEIDKTSETDHRVLSETANREARKQRHLMLMAILNWSGGLLLITGVLAFGNERLWNLLERINAPGLLAGVGVTLGIFRLLGVLRRPKGDKDPPPPYPKP